MVIHSPDPSSRGPARPRSATVVCSAVIVPVFARGVLAQFGLGDGTQVHLIWSVEDSHRAVPAIHCRQRRVVADAGAAVYLDGPVDDIQGDAGYRDLGRGNVLRRCAIAMPIDGLRRELTEQTGLIDRYPGFGNLLLNVALVGQRLAERHPGLGPSGQQRQCALGGTECAHTVVDTPRTEPSLRDGEARPPRRGCWLPGLGTSW